MPDRDQRTEQEQFLDENYRMLRLYLEQIREHNEEVLDRHKQPANEPDQSTTMHRMRSKS